MPFDLSDLDALRAIIGPNSPQLPARFPLARMAPRAQHDAIRIVAHVEADTRPATIGRSVDWFSRSRIEEQTLVLDKGVLRTLRTLVGSLRRCLA